MRCCYCDLEVDGPKHIKFNYSGLDFSIFSPGLICDDCSKKMHIKDFEKYGREIITKEENDKIKVEWKKYLLYYPINQEYSQKMNKILLSLGIFSTSPKGNWIIMAGSIKVTPDFLYFTRQEDAVEFERLFFDGADYNREIWHINSCLIRS